MNSGIRTVGQGCALLAIPRRTVRATSRASEPGLLRGSSWRQPRSAFARNLGALPTVSASDAGQRRFRDQEGHGDGGCVSEVSCPPKPTRPRAALAAAALLLVVVGCARPSPNDATVFLASTPPVPQRARVVAPSTRSASPSPLPDPRPPSPSPDPIPSPGTSALPGSTPGVPVVFLDPGHGGVDTGTLGTTENGTTVAEKTLTLALALRTAALLRATGIRVVLSRTNDSLPGATAADFTSDGTALTADGVLADLQRRIDRANTSGARVLLSIHLNGFDDPSVNGAVTFYDSARPFAAENWRFATLIQTDLIHALRANGYDTPDRGVVDDQTLASESLGSLPSDYTHLVLLGPRVPGRLQPSRMPGALSEPLFLTNPPEASAAVQPAVQNLIAGAYARAIEQFLQGGSVMDSRSSVGPVSSASHARARK